MYSPESQVAVLNQAVELLKAATDRLYSRFENLDKSIIDAVKSIGQDMRATQDALKLDIEKVQEEAETHLREMQRKFDADLKETQNKFDAKLELVRSEVTLDKIKIGQLTQIATAACVVATVSFTGLAGIAITNVFKQPQVAASVADVKK
jgi:hypothetical protein